MYGGGSRKIEGRGNIQRPGDIEYINTVYLPPEKTIKAVRYYNRRKEELKVNGSVENNFRASERNLGASSLKNQIQNAIKSRKIIDPHATNHIKEVKVEPVLNQNPLNGFDLAKYPLDNEEMVEVEREKQFPMESYYNYVYEAELKKEINKFVNETEAKVKEVVQDQFGEKPRTEEQNHFVNQRSEHSFNGKQQRRVKAKIFSENERNGIYSRVDKSKVELSRVNPDLLVPVHIEYSRRSYQQNLIFTVNENKRLEMSRRR